MTLSVVIMEYEGIFREKVVLPLRGSVDAIQVVPSLFKVPALCKQQQC